MRKQLTGEPVAGEPHSGFGGRGRRPPSPTSIQRDIDPKDFGNSLMSLSFSLKINVVAGSRLTSVLTLIFGCFRPWKSADDSCEARHKREGFGLADGLNG